MICRRSSGGRRGHCRRHSANIRQGAADGAVSSSRDIIANRVLIPYLRPPTRVGCTLPSAVTWGGMPATPLKECREKTIV
jgi:hypothetical protein